MTHATGVVAKTFREDVISTFAERLAEIQTANGFFTDAGLQLFIDEVPTLGPDDPPVAIAIGIGEDRVPYNQNEKILVQLPIDVSAIVRVDVVDGWRQREWILADIKKALETPERTLGGLIPDRMRRTSTKSMRREPGSTVMGASVTYTFDYGEPWGGHVAVTP